MKRSFTDQAWEDYLFWHSTDKQMLRKIHALIKDIERNPFDGIGKPEPLKHDFAGYWSRRIDQEHRLVYRMTDDLQEIELIMMRFHYRQG
ncbi:MAG: addiction module toxin, Txe/YoeB family [Verrucomicrobiaceae bacterium]|nr:addiction module toxin, Txe/YoeB family [Verrucomicrobiaceae bacterium]